MIGAEVEKDDLLGAVATQILNQSRQGLLSMGAAVFQAAFDSMPVHGRKESDADYETAPAGEPPYSHTETLRDALACSVVGDYLFAGTLFSKVSVRGAVLEFAAREQPENMKRKSRRRLLAGWPYFAKQTLSSVTPTGCDAAMKSPCE